MKGEALREKIKEMLDLQNKINEKVHPHWREQNFEWYRAIWVECAELLDHYGWKWWKKQSPNQAQIELELVDIWHFGLSILLSNYDIEKSISLISEGMIDQRGSGKFRENLEDFTSNTLQTRSFDLKRFNQVMNDVGLTFEKLYVGYISKNVLNSFRQDKGYQAGTYIKDWGGIEDNEYLIRLASKMDPKSENFSSELYTLMEKEYEAHSSKK
ncbi:MAG: dUTP diphosphatase [Pseudomonadota bacterium]|jgi:dimeric dUTPase (all-alpha-NTP-PPase superfamily)|nr:dUTP diphosphatase [Pseudomonadales bacterium]MEC7158597.1 dUTP diphosphatase [Pseudomonadota bacterium]MEC7390109.1 dUTP diphosphatase [Pseudomonadota bacterium]MEC7455577.1 dUTP diphosphatase [Pseudomonadota bacterium]MEC7938276.1 dUTP diphosphatase [Pseudomonadota bacterium]|tara:strand:+ start:2700 stop:3338 length:639 start_codon:yes stop_codon:yes gene_type:complete